MKDVIYEIDPTAYVAISDVADVLAGVKNRESS